MSKEVILCVNSLKKHFKLDKKTTVKAVDDISFEIYDGEVFGLVGESGSGKTTVGRCIVRLYDTTDGEIIYRDKKINIPLNKVDTTQLTSNLQMVFQDPMSSLNPRMNVMNTIAEGVDIHHLASSKQQRAQMVYTILEKVGLNKEHAHRYPHEFSGGQRQRIGLARALITSPKMIICDEAISALDVSIQAQIVNLLKDLKEELGLSLLFIAHDLSMVRYISDRIAVMYKGKIVEVAEANELYENPLHPYTQSLISAIPLPNPLSERNRVRFAYEPSKHDYTSDLPSMHEITKDHFVYCNQQELADLINIKKGQNKFYPQGDKSY